MARVTNLDDAIRGLRANTVEKIQYVKPTFHRSIQRNLRLTTRTVMSNYKFINDMSFYSQISFFFFFKWYEIHLRAASPSTRSATLER